MRALRGAYAVLAYLAFLASFSYFALFLLDLVEPSVDRGVVWPFALAVLWDLALVVGFGLQHSLMARPAFKRLWVIAVSPALERSTYVLAASLTLALVCRAWAVVPGVVWQLGDVGRSAAYGLFVLGLALATYATFLQDHLQLFGIRQALGLPQPPAGGLSDRGIYGWTRHPMMLGMFIMLWAAPTMTIGHLLFASAMTAYIVIGTQHEERDLLAHFGPEYADYRDRVPRIVPRPWRPRKG